MSLIDVQRTVVELCCATDVAQDRLTELGDERTWRMYRELVRKRLRGELKNALRRTHAAIGPAAFDRAFEHHMANEPPRTRFFHAVVGAFVASAAPLLRADASLPAHAADLLEYEGALWAVSDLPDDPGEPVGEFAFDARPVLSPALRLLALRHAVHARPDAGGGYAQGEFFVCVHRRPDEKRGKPWLLNAITYDLLQRFARGEGTVSEVVQQVASARGIALDAKFVDGLCTVLADFLDRGILLGACQSAVHAR